ncbi:MAG TPA: hypothetical protein VIM11_10580 [Tepidisphaeraceae bacterium]|jgi:Mg2+ and Co2+ transporter CorA
MAIEENFQVVEVHLPWWTWLIVLIVLVTAALLILRIVRRR